jgi:hypothetical protein
MLLPCVYNVPATQARRQDTQQATHRPQALDTWGVQPDHPTRTHHLDGIPQ